MKVGIIGLGFVGLTLATHLAAKKNVTVFGFEKDFEKSESIASGKSFFHEPGINSALKKAIGKKFFVNEVEYDLDCVFITLGTPIDKATNRPNIEYIKEVIKLHLAKIKYNGVIFLRSTITIGLSREIQLMIDSFDRSDIEVCFAPERTIEGAALKELQTLPQLYSSVNEERFSGEYLTSMGFRVIRTQSCESAELGKLISNVYRDLHFGISNLFEMISDEFSVDFSTLLTHVRDGYDRNFGIARPGFVAGPCLSKDAIILNESLQNPKLSELVQFGRQTEQLFERFWISKILASGCSNLIISGLAFKGKPETDDIRDSPTVNILEGTAHSFQKVYIHDFVISENDLRLYFPSYNILCIDSTSVIEDAVLFIGNNHSEYSTNKFFDWVQILNSSGVIVLDPWRNILKEKR